MELNFDLVNFNRWHWVEAQTESTIKKVMRIHPQMLQTLTTEIKLDPTAGKGLANKMIKCIDTASVDIQDLKNFIKILNENQITKNKFCITLPSKSHYLIELFNRYKGEDEILAIALLSSIDCFSQSRIQRLLVEAINAHKLDLVCALFEKLSPKHKGCFLYSECQISSNPVILQLLKKYPDLLNTYTYDAMTLLEIALEDTNQELVIGLINFGVNLNIDLNKGQRTSLFPIQLACAKGMKAAVIRMIEVDKAQLNVEDENKWTPFMIALDCEHQSLAVKLIELGANFHFANFETACELGLVEVVAKMIEQNNAWLNTENDYHATPLLVAIENDCEDLALKLVDLGADLEQASLPLHKACEKGMIRVVAKMIEKNSNLMHVKDIYDRTPLLVAIDTEHEELAVELVALGSKLNHSKGIFPIHKACAKGMVSVVTKMVEKNKKLLNIKDISNKTPLEVAVEEAQELVILKLIELGVKIPKTLFLKACLLDMPAVMTKLIEKNDNLLNQALFTNWSPLKVAITRGKKAVALQLVQLGAIFNAALFQKAFLTRGMQEIAIKMIETNLNLLNHDFGNGKTPLILAIEGGCETLALQLMQLGAAFDEALFKEACLKGMQKIVIKMIKINHTLLNYEFDKGKTPLVLAIEKGCEPLALKLFQLGANIHVQDQDGMMPIHKACAKGLEAVVFKILEYAPEMVDVHNKYNLTPLLIAVNNRHLVLAIKLICSSLNDLTSIQSLLHEAQNLDEVHSILKENLEKILDPSQNRPGANPLKAAFLLMDYELHEMMKEKLETNYLFYLNNLQGIPLELIENMILTIQPQHFEAGSVSTKVPPSSHFELSKLEEFFNEINFNDKDKPGYKNPNKLFDEGRPTNPAELKAGLVNLIKRVKEKRAYTGTPPAGTPALEAYYVKFENLLKNLGQIIEELTDPAEKATHLIDIAIMGLHCGGKIGEAASMYRLLSGQVTGEGLASQIYDTLRNHRLEIIKEWAIQDQSGTSYEVHRFNQYMFLLGKMLHLPEADIFTESDPLSGLENLTREETLDDFYEFYTPHFLINCTQNFIMGRVNVSSTMAACADWLRDHVPPHWQKEKYAEVLSKVRELETKGYSRKKIREVLGKEDQIFFSIADPDPIEVIQEHRLRDYQNNLPKEEEWNSDFYVPILAEIERIEKTADFKAYLAKQGIKMKQECTQENAKIAVLEHRRKKYLDRQPKMEDWQKDHYDFIFGTIEKMQSRDEIRNFLHTQGIILMPDRDFANLLEQARGLKYLEEAFKYDDDFNIMGVERSVIKQMLQIMGVFI